MEKTVSKDGWAEDIAEEDLRTTRDWNLVRLSPMAVRGSLAKTDWDSDHEIKFNESAAFYETALSKHVSDIT